MQFGVSVDDLIQANQLTSTVLQIGEQLKIPKKILLVLLLMLFKEETLSIVLPLSIMLLLVI